MTTLASKPPPYRCSARQSSGSDTVPATMQSSRRQSESPRRKSLRSSLIRQTPLKVKDTSASEGQVDFREKYNVGTASPVDRRAYHEGSDEAMDLTDLENFIAKRAARVAKSVENCDRNVPSDAVVAGGVPFKRRITEADIMEQETKLVILEYLSSATPAQSTPRRQSHRDKGESDLVDQPSGKTGASGVSEVSYKKAVKSHTVHVSEIDRQKLLQEIQAAAKRKTSRSNSDATSEHYSHMRRKFQEMKIPVKDWINVNLRREIISFSHSALHPTSTLEKRDPVIICQPSEKRKFRKVVDEYLTESNQERARKNGLCDSDWPNAVLSKSKGDGHLPQFESSKGQKLSEVQSIKGDDSEAEKAEPVEVPDVVECVEHRVDRQTAVVARPDALRLAIPRRNVQIIPDACEMTPESFVVSRLENISKEIMLDYPDLVEKPIHALLTPLEAHKSLSYESFSVIAKSVYEQNLDGGTLSVWSRIALLLFVVRETMFLGKFDDTQLETMVDHSAKFVAEHAYKDVKMGGESVPVGECDCNSSDDPPELDDMDGECPGGDRKLSRSDATPVEESLTSRLSVSVNKWSGYGLAALAFGIGVALTYLRS